MVWQLLICITNLVCLVQGLLRLSNIICLGSSNPVNYICFLLIVVHVLTYQLGKFMAYTCMHTEGIMSLLS